MKIQDLGPISRAYLNAGAKTFLDALEWTHSLKHAKNSNPSDYTLIFKELCGTSATKHAALAALALELRIKKTVLKLGFSKIHSYLFLSTPEQDFDISDPSSDGHFIKSIEEEHILLPSEIGERTEMLTKLHFS